MQPIRAVLLRPRWHAGRYRRRDRARARAHVRLARPARLARGGGARADRPRHRLAGRARAAAPRRAAPTPASRSALRGGLRGDGRHDGDALSGRRARASSGSPPRSLPLGVVTNKARAFSVRLLERLAVAPSLRRGRLRRRRLAEEARRRHDARRLRAAGSAPAETLLLGDSANDVLAARAAGCPVVVRALRLQRRPAGRDAGRRPHRRRASPRRPTGSSG